MEAFVEPLDDNDTVAKQIGNALRAAQKQGTSVDDKLVSLLKAEQLLLTTDNSKHLLDNFLDEMLEFALAPDFRLKCFVASFIEKACNFDPEVMKKAIGSLSYLLTSDSRGSVRVMKRVITVCTCLYPLVLKWAVTATRAETTEVCWEAFCVLKGRIMQNIETDNEGVRTMTFKFLESLILAQSNKTDDSESGRGDIVNLSDVPSTHRFISLRKLAAEANHNMQCMCAQTRLSHISAQNLLTALNVICSIGRQRPKELGLVMDSLEALHVNLPPTLGTSQVKSVRKELKMHLLRILRHPAAIQFHPRIVTLLTDLGATQNEINRAMPANLAELNRKAKRSGADAEPTSMRVRTSVDAAPEGPGAIEEDEYADEGEQKIEVVTETNSRAHVPPMVNLDLPPVISIPPMVNLDLPPVAKDTSEEIWDLISTISLIQAIICTCQKKAAEILRSRKINVNNVDIWIVPEEKIVYMNILADESGRIDGADPYGNIVQESKITFKKFFVLRVQYTTGNKTFHASSQQVNLKELANKMVLILSRMDTSNASFTLPDGDNIVRLMNTIKILHAKPIPARRLTTFRYTETFTFTELIFRGTAEDCSKFLLPEKCSIDAITIDPPSIIHIDTLASLLHSVKNRITIGLRSSWKADTVVKFCTALDAGKTLSLFYLNANFLNLSVQPRNANQWKEIFDETGRTYSTEYAYNEVSVVFLSDPIIEGSVITKNWLADVIEKKHGKRPTIGQAVPLGKDAIGYMSVIRRVALEWPEPDQQLPASVIVKIASSTQAEAAFSGASGEMSEEEAAATAAGMALMQLSMHNCECTFLKMFENENKTLSSVPFIYTAIDFSSETPVIVMKDYKDTTLIDLVDGFDEKQLYAVVDWLVEIQHFSLTHDAWRAIEPSEEWKMCSQAFEPQFMMTAQKLMEGLPELFGGIQRFLDNTFNKDMHWMTEQAKVYEDGRRQSVMVHGDLWAPQILWGKAGIDVVVDWQLTHAGSPAEDLLRILSTCTSTENRRRLQKPLFDHYYEKLSEKLNKSGKEIPFTRQELDEEIKYALVPGTMITIFANAFWSNSEVLKPDGKPDQKRMMESFGRCAAYLEDTLKEYGW